MFFLTRLSRWRTSSLQSLSAISADFNMMHSRLPYLPSYGHVKLHSGFTSWCTTWVAIESMPQGLLGNLASDLGSVPHLQGNREESSEWFKNYTHQKLDRDSGYLFHVLNISTVKQHVFIPVNCYFYVLKEWRSSFLFVSDAWTHLNIKLFFWFSLPPKKWYSGYMSNNSTRKKTQHLMPCGLSARSVGVEARGEIYSQPSF